MPSRPGRQGFSGEQHETIGVAGGDAPTFAAIVRNRLVRGAVEAILADVLKDRVAFSKLLFSIFEFGFEIGEALDLLLREFGKFLVSFDVVNLVAGHGVLAPRLCCR